jgi:hypothetical protein
MTRRQGPRSLDLALTFGNPFWAGGDPVILNPMADARVSKSRTAALQLNFERTTNTNALRRVPDSPRVLSETVISGLSLPEDLQPVK